MPNHVWMCLLLALTPLTPSLAAAPQEDSEVMELVVATFARVVQLFQDLEHIEEASERFSQETWAQAARVFAPDNQDQTEAYQTRWFREGLIHYYAWLAQTQDGALEAEARTHLQTAVQDYLAAGKAGHISLSQAGMGGSNCDDLLTQGGFLTLVYLDQQLLEEGLDLDTLIRHLNTPYDNAQLAALAEDLTGVDFSAFFDNYVTGAHFLPLDEVLGEWQLRWDRDRMEAASAR